MCTLWFHVSLKLVPLSFCQHLIVCYPPPFLFWVADLLVSANMTMSILMGIRNETGVRAKCQQKDELIDICNICCLFSDLCSLYFGGELLFLPPVNFVLFNTKLNRQLCNKILQLNWQWISATFMTVLKMKGAKTVITFNSIKIVITFSEALFVTMVRTVVRIVLFSCRS